MASWRHLTSNIFTMTRLLAALFALNLRDAARLAQLDWRSSVGSYGAR
jgi:hypothetical protein